MKFTPIAVLAALVATSSAQEDKLHFFDFDNAKISIRETGLLTRRPDHMITTAPLPSPTTGRVPNNALSPGNAEAPECAKEEDGAPDSMDAKDPHSQPKLQVSPTPTELPMLDLRKS